MRSSARLMLFALLGALPSAALAADPAAAAAAGDACQPVVAKLQAGCKAKNEFIQTKKDARAKLAGDITKEAEAKKLDDEMKLLRADAGVCTSVSDAVAQTCVGLASALGGYIQTSGGFVEPSELPALQVKRDEEDEKLKSSLPIKTQADRQTSVNKGGTNAQVDPVESIQPITLAGGAITLAGTRSGTKGVGTITVNPLAIMSPGNVVAGRILDVTVSAPFNLDSGTSQDNRYVSARVRANFTAPVSAQRLELAVTAMTRMLALEGKHSDDLGVILSKTKNPQACVDSIVATKKVTAAACGEALDGQPIEKARTALMKELVDARREADSYYFGMDARLDTGDPTGSTFVGDKGTHILGGLAAGRRFGQTELWDIELRGRFAGDYFKSRDAAVEGAKNAVWSVDWGCAFILSGRLQQDAKQRMAFGVGVEGRQAANKDDAKRELAPTNYANLNLMALVPAANGGDLGLAFSIPIKDALVPRGAIVVLSTDLGLLDHSR
jgi:hypothetical protein